LNISNNVALGQDGCYFNMLNISGMPSLYEVCVWEGFSLDSIDVESIGSPNVYFTTDCIDQYVNIPDTNFKNTLIEKGIDINGDGEISYTEAQDVTYLEMQSRNITDLTGIEAFINLNTFDCSFNYFGSIDVSGMAGLVYLDCSESMLTSLDVTQNPLLEHLDCSDYEIPYLDVSHNPYLRYLNCHNNLLTNLNLSNNTLLEVLWVQENQLSSLDISTNTLLTEFEYHNMPTLYKVCVWTLPFPPEGVYISDYNSPNVYFTTDCFNQYVNIHDINFKNTELRIYPNPFTDYTMISLSDAIVVKKIELMNIYGKVLKTINSPNNNSITIHRENLPAGIYFIRIYSDKAFLKKIIIL